MKSIWKKHFLDHPSSVDESYLEHMGQALYFSSRMIAGGLACFVHGIVPSAFVRTGSGIIGKLYDRMVLNRRRNRDSESINSVEPV